MESYSIDVSIETEQVEQTIAVELVQIVDHENDLVMRCSHVRVGRVDVVMWVGVGIHVRWHHQITAARVEHERVLGQVHSRIGHELLMGRVEVRVGRVNVVGLFDRTGFKTNSGQQIVVARSRSRVKLYKPLHHIS